MKDAIGLLLSGTDIIGATGIVYVAEVQWALGYNCSSSEDLH